MGLNDNVESVFDRIARFDALIVEFIGTFFLCLSFVTSGGNGTAVGLTVLVLVYAFGYISGAHYNPAVTIGVISTARGVISIKNAILYIIIQLVASFIAAGIGWGMVAQPDNDLFMLPIPEPGAGYNWAQAFLAETFYTFALVTVALHVASTKSQEANSFFGLAVAFTIIAAELSVGHISGAVLNPAVAAGPFFMGCVQSGDWSDLKYVPVYWASEILGGILAAIFFRIAAHHKEYKSQPLSLQ